MHRFVLAGCFSCTLLVLAALAAPPTPRQRAQACAALAAQYQRLEARMRTGYSARESQRLWERRRELQARGRALRCHDLPASAHRPAPSDCGPASGGAPLARRSCS